MADVSALWGGDLALTATGDLLLVDDIDLSNQRLIRRLCTNPSDYLWHSAYGAGLPGYIGLAVPPSAVIGAAAAQIAQEQTVARSPAPQLDAQLGPDMISMTVKYETATSGAPVLLEFDVTP